MTFLDHFWPRGAFRLKCCSTRIMMECISSRSLDHSLSLPPLPFWNFEGVRGVGCVCAAVGLFGFFPSKGERANSPLSTPKKLLTLSHFKLPLKVHLKELHKFSVCEKTQLSQWQHRLFHGNDHGFLQSFTYIKYQCFHEIQKCTSVMGMGNWYNKVLGHRTGLGRKCWIRNLKSVHMTSAAWKQDKILSKKLPFGLHLYVWSIFQIKVRGKRSLRNKFSGSTMIFHCTLPLENWMGSWGKTSCKLLNSCFIPKPSAGNTLNQLIWPTISNTSWVSFMAKKLTDFCYEVLLGHQPQ